MPKIEALILDFDGLILDTEKPAYEVWKEIYQEHGVDLPLSQWAICVGRGMVFDPHEHLEKLLGRPLDRESVRRRRQKEVRRRVDAEGLLPGVEGVFNQAEELGLKIGIASSSPRAWVEGHLRDRALLPRIDVLKTSEDVAHTKPDPELFLAALSGLGVSASQAIAFEDSPNGVHAANWAGVFCIVVPNSITSQLSFDGARVDLQLQSLEDANLKEIIHKIETGQLRTAGTV